GIRDFHVTGVQTCALPISGWEIGNSIITGADYLKKAISTKSPVWRAYQLYNNFAGRPSWDQASILYAISPSGDYWDVNKEGFVRSEERRVGNACRSWCVVS